MKYKARNLVMLITGFLTAIVINIMDNRDPGYKTDRAHIPPWLDSTS